MHCASCQFVNPVGMNFCGKCGAALRPCCPQCGFENPAGFGFCGKCGAPLAHEDHPQRALYAARRRQEAMRCYADTLRLVEKNDEHTYEAEVYRIYGELALRSGETESGRNGDNVLLADSPFLPQKKPFKRPLRSRNASKQNRGNCAR
jgi:hypothetical protein